MHLIRRLARTLAAQQATTTITMGELLYGAAKKGSAKLIGRVCDLLAGAVTIVPFDQPSAEAYAALHAELEVSGRPLAEPDLRLAAIARAAYDLTLVTGNIRYFRRVPNLELEDWLSVP